MWVCRVAKWPPARVAIQPPRVENSNDCGKWRSVRPCGRRRVLEVRPERPGADPGGLRDGVDLDQAGERLEVDRDGPPVAVRRTRGSTPPTTLVPPPKGIAASRRSAQTSSTRTRSSSSRGRATKSGVRSKRPRNAADDVAVGAADRVRRPLDGIRADDAVERPGWLQARWGELDPISRDRLLDLLPAESETPPHLGRERLQRRREWVRESASPQAQWLRRRALAVRAWLRVHRGERIRGRERG